MRFAVFLAAALLITGLMETKRRVEESRSRTEEFCPRCDLTSSSRLPSTSLIASMLELVVSVSDTGLGLALQQADRIFNAFFTTKPPGTGMGLLVESHGGRLWVTDNPPRGRSFQLTQPTKN